MKVQVLDLCHQIKPNNLGAQREKMRGKYGANENSRMKGVNLSHDLST